MTDRELMQQALDALINAKGYIFHNVLDDKANQYDTAVEALRARLAQPEPEPVAWVAYENGEKHGIDFYEDEIAELPVGTLLYPIPPHFIDPAKVARLMDEAFERGKKEIDMEQVKDIAQKLADCALLNSAPPQREWKGLTKEEARELCVANVPYVVDMVAALEARLKEKNT